MFSEEETNRLQKTLDKLNEKRKEMDRGYVGDNNKLGGKRKYKVTFQYYMNIPSLKHDFSREVEAENRWEAEAKTVKNYPNVSNVKIVEV